MVDTIFLLLDINCHQWNQYSPVVASPTDHDRGKHKEGQVINLSVRIKFIHIVTDMLILHHLSFIKF